MAWDAARGVVVYVGGGRVIVEDIATGGQRYLASLSSKVCVAQHACVHVVCVYVQTHVQTRLCCHPCCTCCNTWDASQTMWYVCCSTCSKQAYMCTLHVRACSRCPGSNSACRQLRFTTGTIQALAGTALHVQVVGPTCRGVHGNGIVAQAHAGFQA
jgi:hypothetical protein